jgi:short-chain fatty acids transporter
VFAGGVLAGERPQKLAIEAGKSFWSLVPFTMQMAMVIVGGYVVASTPTVRGAIGFVAAQPRNPRAAVACVALFSMLTSLISWGLSLIFSGLLVRAMARRMAGLDYRAAGAAAYLGLGVVWALGLSSSAAMLMATRSSMPAALYEVTGLIPITQTLFLWQSLTMAAILIAAAVTIAYLSAPSAGQARTARDFKLDLKESPVDQTKPTRPAEALEYSPILVILVVVVLLAYLVEVFRTSPQGALAALDLNTYNLIFLTMGLLLHVRPRNFIRAVTECIPATGGVLIQFPFYAMVFGMIANTGLTGKLAALFEHISTPGTYPLLVAVYSAVLGLFVPSGGSKWIIEAPYVMQTAIAHKVHLGWVVQIYNASEALPNLVNPFWMLPLLGILKIRARDLVGYGILQLMVQAPLVVFLCWMLARTVPFVAPVK